MKNIFKILAILPLLGISASKADAPTLEKTLEKKLKDAIYQVNLPKMEFFSRRDIELFSKGTYHEKEFNQLLKEKKLYERDIIYKYISDVYSKINVPDYITKEFVRALIKVESEDIYNAKSRKNARGLMQLTYQAWKEVEKNLDFKKEVYNPQNNIYVGIKYLLWIDENLQRSHSNWFNLTEEEKRKITVAAYNGGLKRLFRYKWNINKMPKETREYVKKIERTLKTFE